MSPVCFVVAVAAGFFGLCGIAAPEDSGGGSLQTSIQRLRGLALIDGCKVGGGGQPGSFFLVARRLLKAASLDDYTTMLRDEAPAVRVMGALGIALQHPEARERAIHIESDRAEVEWVAYGCIVRRATVGEVAAMLFEHPNTFGVLADGSSEWWCE